MRADDAIRLLQPFGNDRDSLDAYHNVFSFFHKRRPTWRPPQFGQVERSVSGVAFRARSWEPAGDTRHTPDAWRSGHALQIELRFGQQMPPDLPKAE